MRKATNIDSINVVFVAYKGYKGGGERGTLAFRARC